MHLQLPAERNATANSKCKEDTFRSDTGTGGSSKRCFDIVFAASVLVMLLPLIFLIAMLVKISDGGPIFYRHIRIGRGERPFGCLKFRTMAPRSDEILERHLQRDAGARAEWYMTRKLKNDPRVTVVGGVLRKLSIDEVPQLINILRGEMSVVGPRPVVADELQLYGPDAAYYLRVRPGLTGAWQVSGRNDLSYQARVALDRAYVENWSFTMDLWIVLKTIPAVVLAKGTY